MTFASSRPHFSRLGALRSGAILTLLLVAFLSTSAHAEAATRTWNGSVSATWATNGNWVEGTAPASGDDVVINGSYTNAPTLDLSGGSVTINSLSLGSSATSVLTISGGDLTTPKKLIVTVDVNIGASGTVTQTANTTTQAHTIFLDIGGNLSITSGGKIDATGKGFQAGATNGVNGSGSGAGTSLGNSGGGAGFGGNGGNGNGGSNSGSPYGSVTQPASIGSGGGGGAGGAGGTGGGAVKLIVAGTATIDGQILATGNPGVGARAGGGSGGSIWLSTGTLAGSGSIVANGGNAPDVQGGAAGGGRIAIYYTTDSSTLTALTAYGGGTTGNAKGGAGTIFKKAAAATNGDLIVDNNNVAGANTTVIASNTFDNITIQNKAQYIIPSTFTIGVAASTLAVLSSAGITINSGGTLSATTLTALSGATTGLITVSSGATFSASSLTSCSNINLVNNGTATINSTFAIGSGCTWTENVAPSTTFTNLTINSGGILNHSANSTAQTFVLNLSLSSLQIDSGGKIDVTGKGFTGGVVSAGNGTGAGQSNGGGGFGGNGGNGTAGSGGITYGSVTQPASIGSGGASGGSGSVGGAGGGAVKLIVSGTATINGQILATGNPGVNNIQGGGGSGGSIWLSAGTLAGSGSIVANGGNADGSNGGAGGGGRIALYYTTDSSSLSALTAFGGSVTGNQKGGAGTIYKKSAAATNGDLVVINNSVAGANTTVNSSNTFDNITVQNAAKYVIANTFTTTLVSSLTTSSTASITINSGGTFSDSSLTSCSSIAIINNGTATINSTFAIGSGCTWTENVANSTTFTNLTINSGGILNHSANTTAQTFVLSLSLSSLTIDVGGKIDTTGLGFTGGTTSNGNGTGGGTSNGGAGFGGNGGRGNNGVNGGATYGSVTQPASIGSGGASGGSGSVGGAGGGAIKLIVSGTLTVNGQILATGNPGVNSNEGAGGSGGSIWINTGTLAGSGSIVANGGNADGGAAGAGGGGRIALYYTTDSSSLSALTAYGGATTGFTKGGAGTIFKKSAAATNGDLIINNNSVVGAATTVTSSNTFDNITVQNAAQYIIPSTFTTTLVSTLTGSTNAAITVNSGGTFSTTMSSCSNIGIVNNGTAATASSFSIGSGCTWTENVANSTTFTNLTINSGGILNHSANSTAQTFVLSLSLSSLQIDSGGKIDVTGLGFTGGTTSNGNGTGGGTSNGGAGFGGNGGRGNNGVNGGATYGSVTQPASIGSGGASGGSGSVGGAGGGAVKLIISGTATINGQILATGNPGVNSNEGGGGSGGSIWINTGTLAGSGSIVANGGNADGGAAGAGGGGRIALYYTTDSSTLSALTAYGGGVTGFTKGGAGTIYKKSAAATNGDLVINNNSVAGANTSANSSNTFDNITVQNAAQYVIPSTFTTTLVSALTGSTSAGITINSGGTFSDSSLTSCSNINIINNGTVTINSTFALGSGCTWTENIAPSTTFTNLTINSGGILNHSANSTAQTFVLNLSLANLTIDVGGKIDVTGLGFTGGNVSAGNGTGAGTSAAGGGGYGGAGGNGVGGTGGGITYGSATQPASIGSGGGSGGGGSIGGAGGGAIKLVLSGTATINGQILATGNPGVTSTLGGGGSGGSVWISTGTFAGSGTIAANGGSASGAGAGGGGGGRIALYSNGAAFGGTVTKTGGAGGAHAGTAGTLNANVTPSTPTSLAPTSYVNGSSVTNTQPTLTFTQSDPDVGDTDQYRIQISTNSDFSSPTVDYLSVLATPGASTFTVGQAAGSGTYFTGAASQSLALGSYYWRVESGDASFATSTYAVANSGAVAFVEADVRTWNGSVSSSWATNGNWVEGSAPDSAADVVINGSYTNAPTLDLSSGSVTIKSLTLGSSATSVLTISNGDLTTPKKLITTGDVSIGASGTLTQTANTTVQTHSLFVDVGGNLTIASGGKIDATAKGFTGGGPAAHAGNGTGGGANGGGGAGYGGNGTGGGATYGSVTQPTDIGSGGGSGGAGATGGAGGGAVKLIVAGTATINGQILATGGNGVTDVVGGGGSGGSIWLNTGTLAGTGSIVANGGNSSGGSSGGGGGRVALYYTTDSSSLGTLSAYGAQKGGAGTIYKKSSGATNGDLIVDNNSVVGANTSTVTSSTFDNITVRNAAQYNIASGNTITLVSTLTGSISATTTISSGGTFSAAGLTSCSNEGFVNNGTATINATFAIGSGCTWAENVANSTTFTNLTVQSGGVLTHSANTTAQTFTMSTSMTSLTVDSGGKIDVTGKGFTGVGPTAGTGHGPGGGSSAAGGGGFGGNGGNATSGTGGGTVYGSVTQPASIGSGGGGGGSGGIGGNGGGAVKITVSGTATINGQILATGSNGTVDVTGAGGSGGSIWLSVGTLAGTGSIIANGGNASGGNAGAGGGGRIALYYTTDSSTLGTLSAYGGTVGGQKGGAGTIFKKSSVATNGDLIVDNNSVAGANTTVLASDTFDNITVRNAAQYVIPSTFTTTLASSLTGSTNAGITINSGGTFATSNSSCSNINITNNGTVTTASTFAIGSGCTWNENSANSTTFTNLTVQSGGVLTHSANTSSQVNTLSTSMTSLTVDSGGLVDVSGKGFSGAANAGNGTGGGGAGQAGGGGTFGGNGGGAAGGAAGGSTTYGSVTQPASLGSQGGGSSGGGGAGGGAMKLTVSGTATINGQVLSNGSTGTVFGGGGSGGSIWLSVGTLAGSGTIAANGGNGTTASGGSGTGGGGRVAIYYTTDSSTLAALSAFGGGPTGFQKGGAGTVFKKSSVATNGDLIVDNNSVAGANTTTAASNTFDNLTVKNNAVYVIANTHTITVASGAMDTTNNNSAVITINSGGALSGLTALTIGGSSTLEFNNLNASAFSLTTLTVNSGGTLTHSVNTSAQTNTLNLSLTTLTLNSGGSIDVSGKGFSGATNSGNGTGGGVGGQAGGGGGFGGNGGAALGGATGGTTYGSVTQPASLGSQGGGSGGGGGAGGGAVKLVVSGTATINGQLLATGNTGITFGGGGAGGSIWLSAGTLTGSGTIQANGGNGTTASGGSGSGGGGRIALYYTTDSSTLATLSAFGGGPTGFQKGGAGTIYKKSAAATNGDLIVDNNSVSGANTTTTASNTFDNITVRNAAQYIIANTHTITLASNFTGSISATTTINSGGTLSATGLTSCSNEGIINNGTVSVSSTFSIGSGCTWAENSTGSAVSTTFSTLTINSGGVLTHSSNAASKTAVLNLSLTALTIDSGGKIDVTAKGFSGATGAGNGTGGGGGAQGGGGGGYGGHGGTGAGGGAGGTTYGSAPQPIDLGSQGGSSGGGGGAGGGAVKLVATGAITVNGQILANGNGGTNSFGGGGSGGSVWAAAGTFAGSGTIAANGGNGGGANAGGGGGGRIALYSNGASFGGTITKTGGTGNAAGSAGTLNSNTAPSTPTSLAPTAFVNGSYTTNAQPALTFTQSDADVGDTDQFRIQISSNSDFSSPVVDYLSALATPGASTFTVGQAAGSGTYTVGTSGQSLGGGGFYWRVESGDASFATSTYAVANSGAVAFIEDLPPTAPLSIGPTNFVNGSVTTSTQPALTITQLDPDGSDTLQYQIQISTHSDFSSPTIDYTSAFVAQGATSFTVGQAAGSGFYTLGSATQTLSPGSYYLRVRTGDNHFATSSYSTANSGSVAFVEDNAPDAPTTLAPTALVNGSYTTNTQPALTFTQADADGSDTVQYQIQISTHADFSSPVVDYLSALATPGSSSFTVGQAAGGGAYTAGSSAQTLSAGNYYWRVRTGDNNFATSSYATANSGSVAFIENATPNTPISLAPAGLVSGSATTNTQPNLTFTQADADGSDTTQYQIQISTHSDFSSPVVDYLSALATPGSSSFTVGQAAGSGAYTVGSASQTLSPGSYYWRVRSGDNHFATSTYAVANSGSIAFVEDNTPDAPTTLAPSDVVDGSYTTDAQPELTFSQSDLDGGDTVQYQIQISTNSDFSSPAVDYTSALDSQGAASFTVGQDAGSGAYAAGTSGQSLSSGSYYWRVRTGDNTFATSTYAVANSGAVAFIENSTPDAPTDLAPSDLVDGSYTTDTEPALTFTTADADGSDTVQYQIQIDDSSDFASPVIDYTSDLAAPGASTFTIGQDAGSGTYTVGSSGQSLSAGSYYWRVRAGDNHFATSSYATANTGDVAFIENTVAGVPTDLAPSDLVDGSFTTDTAPELTFTQSDPEGDNVQYEIQIANSNDFSSPVVDYLSDFAAPDASSFTVGQDAGSGTYVVGSASQTLSGGDYYWRVKTGDVHFATSTYAVANSGAVAFTEDSLPDDPTALAPIDLTDGSYTTGTQPELTFSLSDPDSSDTVQYEIVLDDSPDFSSPIVDYTSDLQAQGSASFTVGQDAGSGTYAVGESGQILISGSYYWEVKVTDEHGLSSSYTVADSGDVAFVLDAPALTPTNLGPADVVDGSVTADTAPSLTFTQADNEGDNVQYEIQIDDDSDFGSPVVDYTSDLEPAGDSSFTVGQDAGAGTYAVGESGQTLAPGDYYWRVKSDDGHSDTSEYAVANSGDVAFTINTAPDAPTTLGPTNFVDGSFTTETQPALTFSLSDPNSSDDIQYEIQIDDNSDFASPVVDYATALSPQGPATFTVGQDAGSGAYAIGSSGQTLSSGTYYWEVKAVDEHGASSGYVVANSGAVAFNVNGAGDAPSSLGPSDLVDGSVTADTAPTFTFTQSDPEEDNVQYEIQIADSSDFASPIIDYTSDLAAPGASSFTIGQDAGSGSYTTGASGQVLSPGSYYWRVKTTDVHGNVSSYTTANSGDVAFVENSTPDAPTSLGPPDHVDGSTSLVGAPELDFTQNDIDGDDVRFEIQIADNADFDSPSFDYLSGLTSSGSTSFTVGQDEGDGTYISGTSGVQLPTGSYYWRVRSSDSHFATSTYAVANAGGVAFIIGTSGGGVSAPTGLGPSDHVDGSSSSDTQPTLTFTQNDPDGDVRYRIEIDDTADFVSPIIDYTSDLLAAGAASFTIGQAAGSGTYTLGAVDQALIPGDYYWQVESIDGSDNASGFTAANSGAIAFSVSDDTPPPGPSVTALGPIHFVDGSPTLEVAPALTFDLSDADPDELLSYQIQIDDDSDFASPLVDYTSAPGAQGSVSFTVGQVEDGGTYTVGSSGQVLPLGDYYWRVRTIDSHSTASDYAAANDGDVAFTIVDHINPPPPPPPPPTPHVSHHTSINACGWEWTWDPVTISCIRTSPWLPWP